MLGEIVKAGLANLSLQTALLEACDWDEKEASAVTDYVAYFLDNLSIGNGVSWDEFSRGTSYHLKQVYGEQIAGIIMDMLEANIKETIFYTETRDA